MGKEEGGMEEGVRMTMKEKAGIMTGQEEGGGAREEGYKMEEGGGGAGGKTAKARRCREDGGVQRLGGRREEGEGRRENGGGRMDEGSRWRSTERTSRQRRPDKEARMMIESKTKKGRKGVRGKQRTETGEGETREEGETER